MSWKVELSKNITNVDDLEVAMGVKFSEDEKERLSKITQQFPLSIPRYYLSLIDKDDENDPIRRLSIPSIDETDLSGSFDTSGESDNTVAAGLQHKYAQTTMLLSTNQCAMYCRHCFRKRLVGLDSDEIMDHLNEIVDYIKSHKEINNVLISGGDSFLNSNEVIRTYLDEFSKIDHLDFIRFGTRVPVSFPMRINEDEELLEILKEYSKKKQIYIVTHFNHPNEITEESRLAIERLLDCGLVLRNQTVLLKGVNDDPDVLAHLLGQLTSIGISPYYVFQCRPVAGVQSQFQIPLKEGSRIVNEAKSKLNGVSKGFRYAMSNTRGKIEILGSISDSELLFQFHEAQNQEDMGKIFKMQVDDKKAWVHGNEIV